MFLRYYSICKKLLLPSIFIYLLAPLVCLAASPLITVSPEDHFLEWYSQRAKLIPDNAIRSVTEYNGQPEGKPLVMKLSIETRGPYSLFVMKTLVAGKEIESRFLSNEKYCASINLSDSKESSWALNKFTSRNQADFSAALLEAQENSGDSMQCFLGPNLDHFRYASISEDSISGTAGSRVKKLVFSFDSSIDPELRLHLTKVTLLLNEKQGWMPQEIITNRNQEGNNVTWWNTYSNWSIVNGIWVFQQRDLFFKKSTWKKKKIHSKTQWTFARDGHTVLEPTDKCYLSHYGLPEPKVSSEGNFAWWQMLLAAALLSGGGCCFLKRLKRQ